MAKVLLADDEQSLTGVVAPVLEDAGYGVKVASNGVEALGRLYQWQPDLVILDVMMPEMDGWETCRRIRAVSDVPVLILTAKGGEANELQALQEGADHFMPKPFSLPVLLARVQALLERRRTAREAPRTPVVEVGDLRVDLIRREATLCEQIVDLSPTEFRLLAALAARAGQVVPRRELLSEVWGPEYADEETYLKLYIWYLRLKLEEDTANPRYILTRRGTGYYLRAGSDSAADSPSSRRLRRITHGTG